jgi:hypothetical protein
MIEGKHKNNWLQGMDIFSIIISWATSMLASYFIYIAANNGMEEYIKLGG